MRLLKRAWYLTLPLLFVLLLLAIELATHVLNGGVDDEPWIPG